METLKLLLEALKDFQLEQPESGAYSCNHVYHYGVAHGGVMTLDNELNPYLARWCKREIARLRLPEGCHLSSNGEVIVPFNHMADHTNLYVDERIKFKRELRARFVQDTILILQRKLDK